jgi:hypothetical protein
MIYVERAVRLTAVVTHEGDWTLCRMQPVEQRLGVAALVPTCHDSTWRRTGC